MDEQIKNDQLKTKGIKTTESVRNEFENLARELNVDEKELFERIVGLAKGHFQGKTEDILFLEELELPLRRIREVVTEKVRQFADYRQDLENKAEVFREETAFRMSQKNEEVLRLEQALAEEREISEGKSVQIESLYPLKDTVTALQRANTRLEEVNEKLSKKNSELEPLGQRNEDLEHQNSLLLGTVSNLEKVVSDLKEEHAKQIKKINEGHLQAIKDIERRLNLEFEEKAFAAKQVWVKEKDKETEELRKRIFELEKEVTGALRAQNDVQRQLIEVEKERDHLAVKVKDLPTKKK